MPATRADMALSLICEGQHTLAVSCRPSVLSNQSVELNSFGVYTYVHSGLFGIFVILRKKQKRIWDFSGSQCVYHE